ncbi:MAG: PD-(D/E)XK nuclease family protein [Planctomycetia bacterium]|nr:PD-(D/E)XK nuclease family protein [Planctomycetia bacterium]
MKKTFLDWYRPCLVSLVDCLAKRYTVGNRLDLSGWVFIFPSRPASRRFLARLADWAYEKHVTVEVPRVRLSSDLPELLYEQKAPFATPFAQQIAWMTALRRVCQGSPEKLQPMFPNPPADEDVTAWLELGELLTDIYQELARDTLDFVMVRDRCRQLAEQGVLSEYELRRWELLARVFQEYHRILDREQVWDKQSARLFALENPGPRDFQPEFLIGIVGCVDLNQIFRRFLAQVKESVEVFVFAPESHAERFESDGCLKPGAWKKLDARLDARLEEVVEQVTTPEDEAKTTARWICEAARTFAKEDLAVGLPDTAVEPLLVQLLQLDGILGPPVKREVSQLQPWRLLERVTECLEEMAVDPNETEITESFRKLSPRYASFASLVRHPDMENYLRHACGIEGEWLAELDAFYNVHLPDRLFSVNRFAQMTRGRFPLVQKVYEAVQGLLEKMVAGYGHFSQLSLVLSDFLKAVYCWKPGYDLTQPKDAQILQCCTELGRTLQDKFQASPGLLREASFSLPEALRLLLDRTMGRNVPVSNLPEPIAMYRWLDLSLDDARAVVVAGLNEEFVPETVNEHLLMPNRLRMELGIKTNDSRFERDVYLLSTLLASRESLKLVFARIGADGKPLMPSRVLLTCDDETLARRSLRFFREPEEETDFTASRKIAPSLTLYQPPNPVAKKGFKRAMSVTEFDDFLTSEYGYYLRHIQNLEAVDDDAEELNAALFGTLAHSVLEQFAREEIERQKNRPPQESLEKETARIVGTLRTLLERECRRVFDATTHPVVTLQKEQLAIRLAAFAVRQAQWQQAGWQILCAEENLSGLFRTENGRGEPVNFGDGPMEIRGKIDRIDYHPTLQQWQVWDYKTSSGSKRPNTWLEWRPEATSPPPTDSDTKDSNTEDSDEFNGEIWKNLQLPLYRHLLHAIRQTDADVHPDLRKIALEKTRFGYILLPRKDKEAGFYIATNWNEKYFQEADSVAIKIAQTVRDGVFQKDIDKIVYRNDLGWLL